MAAIDFKTSSSVFEASNTSVVVPKPVGTLFPDLLLFFGLKRTGAAGSWSLPAGWTLFEATSVGGLIKTAIASKFVDDSDLAVTDYTFTFAGGGSAQMNGILARIGAACGIDGAASSSASNQPILTMLCSSYNVVKNQSLVLRIPFYIFATTEPSSLTAPAGVTLRETSDGPGSNDSQIKLYTDDALFSPGASGSKTFTAVGSSGNLTGRFYTLGIEPSPSGIGGLTGEPMKKDSVEKSQTQLAREKAIAMKAPVKNKWQRRHNE